MLADLLKPKICWPGIFMEFIFTISWNWYCDVVDILYAFIDICQAFLHIDTVSDVILVRIDLVAMSSLGEIAPQKCLFVQILSWPDNDGPSGS